MLLIVSRFFVPKGYSGITIFPFIILRERQNQKGTLINHEKIHIRQQLETAVVLFFIWYTIEFLVRYLMVGNKRQAYRNISFEREAYANDTNPNYLKQRSTWAFLRYL